MAVLRPMITPTVGIPQSVVASRRPRNMSQREFYSLGSRQQLAQPRQPEQQYQQPNNQQQEQQFEQAPVTGDYLQEQFARFNNRAAPPMLEPGSRVKSARSELVQPTAFKTFYEQLQSIGNFGQAATATEVAKSAFRRMQALQQPAVDAVGTTSSGGSSGGRRRQGSTGNAYGNAVPSNPAANFKFAQEIGPQFGWTGAELQAWYTLGMKESGWRHTAQNPTSTAYGIGQFLNSTWAGVGHTKTSDPRTQVLAMAKYIRNRYGSPSKALAFHLKNNWY